MEIIKKVLVFILSCAAISLILPLGYFIINLVFLGASFSEAFHDFLLTFGLMFVVTFIGLLWNKKDE
ncbi:hypothetical protein [Enterococcus sp. 5B3_DIV0040]|uniref:hypothetical protein n=1 Tax=Enterococcus sp. 5B3_DIV0040 TaxID=1834182 RepID=UPI000A35697A|nr:hypothetical protein [Enterococcus sp. 5B3_DIV0040]OTO03255.1 hypothetical protein A5883_000220 [Enterococcus sp. 5B3_DIV0040]